MSYKDKEKLNQLYWENRKSLKEIGEMFDVSPSTIHYWMDKHNIERRIDSKAGTEKRRVKYANYLIDTTGYPSWQSWNREKQDNIHVRVHQLLAISKGVDPHKIFDGIGNTVIHHKNGCKLDNRKENIEVTTASEHGKHHIKEKPWMQ